MKKILLIALLTVLSSNAFASITGAVCTKGGRTIYSNGTDGIYEFMKENKANGWNCQYLRG